jgi:hypothetical protein
MHDAAFVPRPHTAYSTAKAAANAMSLAKALNVSGAEIVEGVKRWEPDQHDMGERLRILGKQLGDRAQF